MIAVLTADLIDSTHYEEEILKTVLNNLSEEFEKLVAQYGKENVRFNIYRGDSFQGIINQPEAALEIMMQIKTAVNKIHLKQTKKNKSYSKIADFKMAIGIGTLDFERDSISESNGQAFLYSGRTLDTMNNDSRKTMIKTEYEEINEEFNTAFYLMDTLTEKWSTASAEVVYYLLKNLKEREVATAIGISQSAVNQRKKAAGWDAIEGLLIRFKNVVEANFVNRKII